MYNHEPPGYQCPLCVYSGGGETSYNKRSDIFYEDSFAIGFVSPLWFGDIKGNVLIIPKEHFENIFKPYPNIEVIAKEYSIQRLLEKTRILITIQSTAVYEALQAGRKVILLKRSTYERHQDIFDNSNVHLVSNANDLTNAINAPIDKNIVEFFSNFNNEVLQAALAQYNN